MDFKDWYQAGTIAKQAREFGCTLIKEGASYLEVAEKIEAKIVELGGKCAFPVDLSVNHVAAHDSPVFQDERVFVKGDLVRLDLGAHIHGAVADTACTVEVGTSQYVHLIKASEDALSAAISLAKPGTPVRALGKIIAETITKAGAVPIVNLSGHGIDRYQVHTAPTIPNYDNGDETLLKKGQVIAIEPFATDGAGKIFEGKGSQIYSLVQSHNVRDPRTREILMFIVEEYKTLPFAARWLIKKFGLRAKLALKQLQDQRIVQEYGILPEKEKGMVGQFEHTLIVGDKVIT